MRAETIPMLKPNMGYRCKRFWNPEGRAGILPRPPNMAITYGQCEAVVRDSHNDGRTARTTIHLYLGAAREYVLCYYMCVSSDARARAYRSRLVVRRS